MGNMEDLYAALNLPDTTTPVYGFRAWTFERTHHGVEFPLMIRNLSPGTHRKIWWNSDGWTFATCHKPVTGRWAGQKRCPGPTPHINCECGLYAYHFPSRIRPYEGSKIVGAVVGQGMEGSGVIRHGREGWRAEQARPIAFVRPHTVDTTLPAPHPQTHRYYEQLGKEVQGFVERLAFRLGARLFDSIEDMADWVESDSGYEPFWTADDEINWWKDRAN